MNARLEAIMRQLVQRHASHLINVPSADDKHRMAQWARGLAHQGVLVLVGDVPQGFLGSREEALRDWISAYGELYYLLVNALFPSLRRIQAAYADNKRPTMIILDGDASYVLSSFCGYIVPYVARRQTDTVTSQPEIQGLMQLMLQKLLGEDIERDRYDAVIHDGIDVIQRLLEIPVRQMPLADFERPIFRDKSAGALSMTGLLRSVDLMPLNDAPPRPTSMPENVPDHQPNDPPQAPPDPATGGNKLADPLFRSDAPIFFPPRPKTGKGGQRRRDDQG